MLGKCLISLGLPPDVGGGLGALLLPIVFQLCHGQRLLEKRLTSLVRINSQLEAWATKEGATGRCAHCFTM